MPCNAKYCWMLCGAGKPVKSPGISGRSPTQNTIAVVGNRSTCKKVTDWEASLLPTTPNACQERSVSFIERALSVNRNVKMAQHITGSQVIPTHTRFAHYPQAVDSQETL